MQLLTNEFFIMHLLPYKQNWDHLLLKSGASVLSITLKYLGFGIVF